MAQPPRTPQDPPAPAAQSRRWLKWPGFASNFDPYKWGAKTSRYTVYSIFVLLLLSLWWRSNTATTISEVRDENAKLSAQLEEARAKSGTTIDTSKLMSSSQMTELENIVENTAKSEEIKGLASTLGEINGSLKLLAEKPAVDVSGLATKEAVTALKTSMDQMIVVNTKNMEVVATVDTTAFEKSVAALATKVGDPSEVLKEVKALREELAKIPAPAQADAGVTAMTQARDEVVTQLRASEAKLAAAEAKATAMEQYADGLIKWANDNIAQLGYKFQQGQDGAWSLAPTQ